MERYLGLDVHAQSCTLAVISESGRRLRDLVIETNGQALIEAIRLIPGAQAPVSRGRYAERVALRDPRAARRGVVVVGTRGERGQKSDKLDAYGRAEELRRGIPGTRVFKAPRSFTLLRELARSHLLIGRDGVRVQTRLKSVNRPGFPGGSNS